MDCNNTSFFVDKLLISSKITFNLHPALLNPTDLIMNSITKVKGCHWDDTYRIAVVARRCLNEGFSLILFFTVLYALAKGTLLLTSSLSDVTEYIAMQGLITAEEMLEAVRILLESEQNMRLTTSIHSFG